MISVLLPVNILFLFLYLIHFPTRCFLMLSQLLHLLHYQMPFLLIFLQTLLPHHPMTSILTLAPRRFPPRTSPPHLPTRTCIHTPTPTLTPTLTLTRTCILTLTPILTLPHHHHHPPHHRTTFLVCSRSSHARPARPARRAATPRIASTTTPLVWTVVVPTWMPISLTCVVSSMAELGVAKPIVVHSRTMTSNVVIILIDSGRKPVVISYVVIVHVAFVPFVIT